MFLALLTLFFNVVRVSLFSLVVFLLNPNDICSGKSMLVPFCGYGRILEVEHDETHSLKS